MKWLWIALAVLAALIAVMAVVGAMLPKEHAVARQLALKQRAAAVFAVISDVMAAPTWRQLKSVERLPEQDGKRCFREVSGFGPMDLRIERCEPDRLFVTRIVTKDSPFGGTWTIRLAEAGGATTVTVTERGEVYNVFFRFLSRFVFGHTGTIDGYLRALAKKFGDGAEPQAAEPDPPPV